MSMTTPEDMEAKLAAAIEAREAEHRKFLEWKIDTLIAERRILPSERASVLARVLKDESLLEDLRLRQPARPDLVLPPLTIAPPPGIPATSTWLDWYRRTHPLPEAPICDHRPGNPS